MYYSTGQGFGPACMSITMKNKTKMKYFYLLILFLLMTSAVNGQNAKDTLNTEYINSEKIDTRTDLMPEFPGGGKKMSYFIRANFKYPVKAQLAGVSGYVVVKILVSKTGNIIKYSINKSAHPLLDQEALRVVKRMPKKGWTPGKVNGESVDMYRVIPITFRLGQGIQDNQ